MRQMPRDGLVCFGARLRFAQLEDPAIASRKWTIPNLITGKNRPRFHFSTIICTDSCLVTIFPSFACSYSTLLCRMSNSYSCLPLRFFHSHVLPLFPPSFMLSLLFPPFFLSLFHCSVAFVVVLIGFSLVYLQWRGWWRRRISAISSRRESTNQRLSASFWPAFPTL